MRHYMLLGFLALAACGESDGTTEKAGKHGNPRLSGTLLLESNEPLETERLIRLDLATGRYTVEVDGVEGRSASARIVFVQRCGDRGTGERLAIADGDGFVNPASPCENDKLTTNFHSTAISKDGKRIAAVDTMIVPDAKPGASALRNWARKADAQQGVRVYTATGDLLATFTGYVAPAWTRKGRLIMVGTGESGEAPHGIYAATPDLKSVARIDDGRLNNTIRGLEGHPQADRAAFIYNNQLWEIDLTSGAPQRRLAFDFPLAYAAYSPDGKKLAFVVQDPLDEGTKRAGDGVYFVHVLDGDTVLDVPIDFIPGGPLTWISE